MLLKKKNIYEYGSLFQIKYEHCKYSCWIKIPYIKFHHKWNSILSVQMDRLAQDRVRWW